MSLNTRHPSRILVLAGGASLPAPAVRVQRHISPVDLNSEAAGTGLALPVLKRDPKLGGVDLAAVVGVNLDGVTSTTPDARCAQWFPQLLHNASKAWSQKKPILGETRAFYSRNAGMLQNRVGWLAGTLLNVSMSCLSASVAFSTVELACRSSPVHIP